MKGSSFWKFASPILFLVFALPLMAAESSPSARVLAFYYGWYGNPETDGAYHNWNHAIADSSGRSFPGGDDIGANYFPEAGTYSSNDPVTLDRQMRELKRARVGAISVSWWGKGHRTDRSIPLLLEAAHRHGLVLNFHIEPFGGRNAATTGQAIRYLVDTYGTHPAFQRLPEYGNRPLFFLYDSYLTPATEWSDLLTAGKPDSIRGTKYDALVIGLWVKKGDGDAMLKARFDGFYTYFGSNGFTWGSNSSNWAQLAKFAEEKKLIFIPSVGPGYIDTRIRPWNHITSRSRAAGKNYRRMFEAAIEARAPLISITSYNEWHEGTQIEPAVPKSIASFTYLDYTPLKPDSYLDLTAELVGQFEDAHPRSK